VVAPRRSAEGCQREEEKERPMNVYGGEREMNGGRAYEEEEEVEEEDSVGAR